MSFRYMLDTDVISSLVREPQGRVARKVRQAGESQLCCSVVVAGELRFGIENRGSAQLRKRVDAVLANISILPLAEPVDEVYGKIRSHLKQAGEPIGSNDFWIAAHALTERLTLVTANVAEFHRVPGLAVENWQIG